MLTVVSKVTYINDVKYIVLFDLSPSGHVIYIYFYIQLILFNQLVKKVGKLIQRYKIVDGKGKDDCILGIHVLFELLPLELEDAAITEIMIRKA